MKQYAVEICKLGQGPPCCSYLVVGPQGLECAKLGSLRTLIDTRRAAGTMKAMGDNCDGQPPNMSLKSLDAEEAPPA